MSTTEIMLFAVDAQWRRYKLGSVLFQYIKHLAVLHGSKRLYVL